MNSQIYFMGHQSKEAYFYDLTIQVAIGFSFFCAATRVIVIKKQDALRNSCERLGIEASWGRPVRAFGFLHHP
jgi:hypothetical protein